MTSADAPPPPAETRPPSRADLEDEALAVAFATIAARAGRAILDVYKGADHGVREKADRSVVCDADERAEELIVADLAALMPGVPVIAEEAIASGLLPPRLDGAFLLVDPVDGTRHFIQRDGQFSVNIALIDAGAPRVGCIYGPVSGVATIGAATARECQVAPGAVAEPDAFHPISTRAYPAAGLDVTLSATCISAEAEIMLAALPVAARHPMGSALKFCAVARGEADLYPRFGATMEWDTAAGEAIVRAAGGCVTDVHGAPLGYGKADKGFTNEAFIVWGGPPLTPQASTS